MKIADILRETDSPKAGVDPLKVVEFRQRGLPLPTFVNVVTTDLDDETQGVLYAINPETKDQYGFLDWSLYGTDAWIVNVRTFDPYQRLGIASALVHRFRASMAARGCTVKETPTTPDGAALKAALDGSGD